MYVHTYMYMSRVFVYAVSTNPARKKQLTLAICINFKIQFSLSWSAVEVASFVRSVGLESVRFRFVRLVPMYAW